MFVDYVGVMLLIIAIGSFTLAYYLFTGVEDNHRTGLIPLFGILGIVAVILGLHMSLTWPLPGAYNEPYGSSTLLAGMFYLGIACALARNWSLRPLSIFVFFTSIVALIIGLNLIILKMTKEPLIAGTGFILTGLGGILIAINFFWKAHRTFAVITAILMAVIGITWAFFGYMAFWDHMASAAKWVPPGMSR
jgi:putative membrane protein